MSTTKLRDTLRRLRLQAEQRSASLKNSSQSISATSKSDGDQENSIVTASTNTRVAKTEPVQERQPLPDELAAKQSYSAQTAEKCFPKNVFPSPVGGAPLRAPCAPASILRQLPKFSLPSDNFERGRARKIRTNSTEKREMGSNVIVNEPICLKNTVDAPTPVRSDSLSRRDATHHIMVNKNRYTVLELIGKGGSSKVYQVLDDVHKKIFAVKWVDLADTDKPTRTAYLNEIKLLMDLRNTGCVVEMFDYELRDECLLMVMEKGEIDLATFLRTKSSQIDEIFIRFYWSEMLKCVKTIHDRGVVHSDLKPANFLLVGGNLKLIDFGIASSIPTNRTSVVKDSQMGTISYMAPEAFVCISAGKEQYKVQKKSDVWALGCILYNMVYGHTPYQNYVNVMQRTQAIVNKPVQFEEIDDKDLLDVMQKCLMKEPKMRASVEELLNHPYLTRKNVRLDESVMLTEDKDLLRFAEDLRKCTPRTSAKKLGKLLRKTDNREGKLNFGSEEKKFCH